MYILVLGLGLLISLAVLAYYVRSPLFSVFHPLTFYSAFHFLVFVIRPFFGHFQSFHKLYQVFGFNPSLSDKVTVILAANLGYLVFAFFCMRAGNVALQFRRNDAVSIERKLMMRAFWPVLAICAPIAIYSQLHIFDPTAKFNGLVLDFKSGVVINTTSNGYFSDAQLMLAPLCAVIAWLGRFKLPSLLPAIAFVIVRGTIGMRGPFVATAVMMLLLYLYDRRKLVPDRRFIAVALAGVAFFNFVGADRGERIRDLAGMGTDKELRRDNATEKFMESMDIANMEFFEYIVWVVPQRSGTYDYFLNNLQIFTEPIPRVLWKGKPKGAPIQPVKLFDYGFPIGMTYSLPGAGWYSLGWLGVVIWCALWGQMTGTVYRRFCQSDRSTLKIAAFVIFTASLVLSFRDGVLLTAVRQLGIYMTPIVLWYLSARYMGVPRLSELQHRMAAGTGKHGASTPDRGQELAAWQALPPAVQRRRLALQANASAPGGE